VRPDRSYRCEVCGWQGVLEPCDTENAADCPKCGLLLTPQTWGQTWGVALAIVGATVLLIFLAASRGMP
jgi:uncharacterized paraquat-inducible protein A